MIFLFIFLLLVYFLSLNFYFLLTTSSSGLLISSWKSCYLCYDFQATGYMFLFCKKISTKMWFSISMLFGRMLVRLDGFQIMMLMIFLHWPRRLFENFFSIFLFSVGCSISYISIYGLQIFYQFHLLQIFSIYYLH